MKPARFHLSTFAWFAVLLVLAAIGPIPATDAAPPSTPIKHRLDPDAEGRNKALREAWIERMHRAGPGVNWREIEAANAQENFLRRQVQNQASVGPWSEIGAINQTGRNHVTVSGPNGTDLFIGTDRGGLWRGTTGGGPWTPLSDDVGSGVHSMVCVEGSPEVLVTTTDNGLIYHSIDDGATWSVPAGLPDDVVAGVRLLNEPGTRTVYLLVDGWRWVGFWVHEYELLRSTDGGQSFAQVHTEPISARPDIWIDRVTPGQPLYLMVGATLKRSLDQGDTFSVVGAAPVTSDRVILVGSEAGAPTLYAALRTSGTWKLYRSTDAGASWSFRSNISDFFQTLCASILDADLVFTGGVNCARSTNGGSSFSLINEWFEYYEDPTNKLHADLFGLEAMLDAGGSSETLYFDTDGGTYRSTDGGLTVTNLTETGFGNAQYYSIFTSKNDPNLIAAGAQDQGMQISTPGATPLQFDQIISGDYGHLTSAVKDHNMLWSVYPGFILLQLAEGSTALEYPDFPPHGQHSWLPNILADPDDPSRLYFCADHLWQIDRTGPGSYAYIELPQNFDGGASEFLTAFAISPADHDYWYAVTNEGSLWHSQNAGATWALSASTGPDDHYFYGTELLPSPTDANECFVGGSGYGGPGIYRTTDGGASWTAYNTGLPSTLVYGLAFNNHVEQVLYAATEAGPFVYDPVGGWTNLLTTQCCAPLTTYWDVETLPNQGIVRFATHGRGIWDFQTSSPVGVPQVARPLDGPTLEVFPSPAARRATLAFTLERPGHVKLEVFDVAGHRVARPADGFRAAGRHALEFNLHADNGRRLESGIYLVRVLSDDGADVRKLRISR